MGQNFPNKKISEKRGAKIKLNYLKHDFFPYFLYIFFTKGSLPFFHYCPCFPFKAFYLTHAHTRIYCGCKWAFLRFSIRQHKLDRNIYEAREVSVKDQVGRNIKGNSTSQFERTFQFFYTDVVLITSLE